MATPLAPDVRPTSLDEMARDYVELVSNGEPDRLGRYIHEHWGTSTHLLYLMQIHYGAEEANRAINRIYKENG